MSDDAAVQIARLSRRMAWICRALLWLVLPALALYVVILPEQLPHHGWVASAGFTARPLPPAVALAVWGALGVIALPALWGLWSLRRLFEGYAAGAIFTVAAARRLRHCGVALVVAGLETPFGSALLSVSLSFDLPKGSRMLVLSWSGNDVVLLVVGALLLIVGRVMGEAARIAEDNAGFV